MANEEILMKLIGVNNRNRHKQFCELKESVLLCCSDIVCL